MALTKHLLELILEQHKRRPLTGPVLTLGRQSIHCTYETMLELFHNAGIEPLPLSPHISPYSSPALSMGRLYAANDEAFYAHLGLELRALDFSTYEGADIPADLNEPVAQELHESFGTIIDGGTLEHVFDVRRALANIATMLMPEGVVFHQVPANNYVNHGFYQFSPTLFFDYYAANQFIDIDVQLLFQPREGTDVAPWQKLPYDHVAGYAPCLVMNDANSHLLLHVCARKTPTSTSDAVPTQKFFQKLYDLAPHDPELPRELQYVDGEMQLVTQ